jgi:hypothetical protein
MAARDSPVINPTGAFFAHIVIGQAISGIAKRILQSNKFVTTLSQ